MFCKKNTRKNEMIFLKAIFSYEVEDCFGF